MPESVELDVEDAKLVTLARAARARANAIEGAAVRDGDGRTYAAATVNLPSLALSALQLAVATAVAAGASTVEAAAVVTEASTVDGGGYAGGTGSQPNRPGPRRRSRWFAPRHPRRPRMTSPAAPAWPVPGYPTEPGRRQRDRGEFWPLQGHKSSTIVDHDLSREGHNSAYRVFHLARARVGRGVGG